MESIKKGTKAISVKKLQDNEKLPKEIIEINTDEERANGITDFSCAIFTDYSSDRYTNFKINGEYSGRMSRYTLMMFLVYNGNGDLIDASFDEKIADDFKGKKTFSQRIQVPKDEYISKVSVRFIPDPVFL
jgi:hypothetical protein